VHPRHFGFGFLGKAILDEGAQIVPLTFALRIPADTCWC